MSTVRLLAPPHIRDAVKGAELRTALEQLGGFLAEQGLTEIFAARTLHMHFPVSDDEAVLEGFDPTERAITTRVVRRSELTGAHASQWGFFADGVPVALTWAVGAGSTPEVEAAVDKIGRFMADKGLTRVLAIELRDDQLNAGDGQGILELTDEKARTQRTSVVSLEEIGTSPAAGWTFTREGEPRRGTWCTHHNRPH